jgi:hypothetical protein
MIRLATDATFTPICALLGLQATRPGNTSKLVGNLKNIGGQT